MKTAKNLTNFFNKLNRLKIASALLSLSLLANACQLYLFYHGRAAASGEIGNAANLPINNRQAISQVESYLDSISSGYVNDVKYLGQEYNLPSWGCGPSAYSLARILDKKFFAGRLTIHASYDGNEPYQIIERFGFHSDDKKNIVDHAWLEIYFNDKFLFVDPTLGQFGGVNKIVYQLFTVGDPNISINLLNQYGIVDIRLGLLLEKAVNRLPASEEPYPGSFIAQNVLDYYISAYDDRNDVNNGKEPASWHDWDQYLLSRYN